MKENVTAVDREKAEVISDTKIKVKVIYPENVPETIRIEKINHIYDILAKHIGE